MQRRRRPPDSLQRCPRPGQGARSQLRSHCRAGAAMWTNGRPRPRRRLHLQVLGTRETIDMRNSERHCAANCAIAGKRVVVQAGMRSGTVDSRCADPPPRRAGRAARRADQLVGDLRHRIDEQLTATWLNILLEVVFAIAACRSCSDLNSGDSG